MSNHQALTKALGDLEQNPAQKEAVHEKEHCVVLAGPGSGKTKTLTIAMARTLMEDVKEPRGIACITYNNECAIELETRLTALGITNDGRNFIGTVHSFALTQVIMPYARCIPGLLPDNFRVASQTECKKIIEDAYAETFGSTPANTHDKWKFAEIKLKAEIKRRRDIDRNLPNWRESDSKLADFIEAYERILHRQGLIDFDDMPLIAFRMIKEHAWIRSALKARFPVLFVDEYQDLGHALHKLVLLLCFEGGIRLFAVGDADQSIYGFTGANPALLQNLTKRSDVRTRQLLFNYRSGKKIIRASLDALGEKRDYQGLDGTPEGILQFVPVSGSLDTQASEIAKSLLPNLFQRYCPEQIAILYREAWLGNKIATALDRAKIPFMRTDGNALIKRSSRLARFIEAYANWVTGGWKDANPRYTQLLRQAIIIIYAGRAHDSEENLVSSQLITFLRNSSGTQETAHNWLKRLYNELILPWKDLSRNPQEEWDICLEMIEKTDPKKNKDMPLNFFAGRIEGSGRVNLSTLHSAKGREFDAVILYGMNADIIPGKYDETERALREARRLFYVGVTRPRKELILVYQKGNCSPWIEHLDKASQ